MARSKREIPHYYLATTIDVRRALDWLAGTNLTRPVTERLLPAALLLKATAVAAREVPGFNGWWAESSARHPPCTSRWPSRSGAAVWSPPQSRTPTGSTRRR